MVAKTSQGGFEQLGANLQEAFGYKIIEPLVQLRKDGVGRVGEALGLPSEAFQRIPFPGPVLSARVISETTPERIDIVRRPIAADDLDRLRRAALCR
jgi:GMP synthase (glutamine-hydrolysing)